MWGPLQWTNPPGAPRPEALFDAPSDPGLAGPLYWKNEAGQPPNAEPQRLPPTNNYGQTVGLLGPLKWRNTPASPQMLAAPVESGMPGESRIQVAQRPFTLLQGEELVTPPAGEVIPIPSGVPQSEQILPPATTPIADGQSLAGADSLGEEPEDNRLQFLRADTVLLEPGEIQYDIGVTYQLIENDFAVVDTSTSTLVEAKIEQRQLTIPVEIRYGVTRRAQFFIGAPIGWAHTEFTAPGVSDDESDGGVGDITFGTSLLLFEDNCGSGDTVFTFAATAPTGDDPFTGTAIAATTPSLGEGFWALSADILRIKVFDPVVVFYGVGCRHQFEREFNGVDIRPGNEYRLQLGVGFAVNTNITLSTRFNASYLTRTQIEGISIPESMIEPMSVRFAATVFNKGRLVEPFATVGTTEDAPSTRFGCIWTY
ncbi:MAG: transporter [Planctomycetota bacterium]